MHIDIKVKPLSGTKQIYARYSDEQSILPSGYIQGRKDTHNNLYIFSIQLLFRTQKNPQRKKHQIYPLNDQKTTPHQNQ